MLMKRLLKLTCVMFLLASTVACGSSGGPRSTPDIPATQLPLDAAPTEDGSSHSATAAVPSGEPLDVDFTIAGLAEGTADPGWTRYTVALAIHNNEADCIYLAHGGRLDTRTYSGGYVPNLPQIDVLSNNSYVETVTGETYPATLVAPSGSVIIPGGLIVWGTNSSRDPLPSVLSATYDVPSLLEPARLVIFPGLSSGGTEPLPLSLDLTQELPESPLFEPTITIDPLPTQLQLNQHLVLRADPNLTVDSYGHEQFSLGLSVQNLDITANQDLELYLSLTDPNGVVRLPIRGPAVNTIGPAITVDIPSDFSFDVMPPPSEIERVFLTLITDQSEKTYSISLSSLDQKTERIEEAFSVADGTKIVIDNFAGNITIRAGQQGEVSLVATRKGSSWAAIDVETDQQSDQLIIGTRCDGCRDACVEIDLLIPPEVTLSIRTGAGNISAGGPTREIELHTGAGTLEVSGAAGPVNLETAAGGIWYEGRPHGSCTFEAAAGEITLTVPPDIQATLDLSTGMGTVKAPGFAVDGEIAADSIRGSIGDGSDASIYAHSGVGNVILTPR